MLACDRPGNIVCEYMWRRLHLQECNINVALTSPSQTGCIRCIAYRFRWLLYVAMMWVWFFFFKMQRACLAHLCTQNFDHEWQVLVQMHRLGRRIVPERLLCFIYWIQSFIYRIIHVTLWSKLDCKLDEIRTVSFCVCYVLIWFLYWWPDTCTCCVFTVSVSASLLFI